MEITVTIKSPDLITAARALASAFGEKALIGHDSKAQTGTLHLSEGELAKLHEGLESTSGPGPVGDPGDPGPVNPTPAGYSPATPAPIPQSAPTSAAVPVSQMSTPVSQMSTPVTTTPGVAQIAPTHVAVPTTPAPAITGDQVAKAGADLLRDNPGAYSALMALLQKYGAGCAQELRPDQIGPFATEMRALGAKI